MPLTGTKNIPGDYATLAAAITDLNAQGVGAGGVTLNLLAANPQTAPAGGYVIGGTGSLVLTTTSAANPVTIQGNANTITAPTPQASGSLNDAIFKLIGADWITITGFTMQENAANTTTAAGSNNMTEWGVALLYVTTINGAQNNTIQNNTITLNRAYQNTFGIYSNSTHSATAITSATATTAAGGNSGLKIYGNNINNVNLGIVVIGPTAAADNNNPLDIGGAAAGTGNTITNYGRTGTFSGYANVDATVNGILVRNTKNYNVSFNTVTSSNGGTTSGTLRGIFVPAFSNAPTGTITNTINNNAVSVRSAVAAGVLQGIIVEATTVNATTTLNINNNDFNTSGHTVAASGAITFISNEGASLNQNINNNTFTNMTVNTTGSVNFVVNAITLTATGSMAINNNSVVTGFSKTGAGGTVTFFSTTTANSVNGATVSNSSNNISNITLTGATGFTGINNIDGASSSNGPVKTINGNTFNNISGGTGTMNPMTVNFSGANSTVNSNTISNITWGAATTCLTLGSSNQATLTVSGNIIDPIATTAGAVVGLTSAAPTANITGNTIFGLSSSAAVSVTGISVTDGTTVNVSKNKIYDLSGSNAASTVSGLLIDGGTTGTTVTVFNNLIGNLTASAATGANAINGINITSTQNNSTIKVYYNTVYVSNPTSGAGFGSSGIFTTADTTATQVKLDLRNNIIVNTSVQNGAGLTVAYRRSSGAANRLNNYASTSNNNDFYAGTVSATHLIFYDGTNSDLTIAAYKTRVGPMRDSASLHRKSVVPEHNRLECKLPAH